MNPSPKAVKVIVPPSRTNGSVSRMVQLEDGSARVETWGASGWEPGGADIASVSKAPPASPEVLAKLGIPSDPWATAPLGRASQDYDEIELDAAIRGLTKSVR